MPVRGKVGDQVLPVAWTPPEQAAPLYQLTVPAGLAPTTTALAVSVVVGDALQMVVPAELVIELGPLDGVLLLMVMAWQVVAPLQASSYRALKDWLLPAVSVGV